MQTAEITARYLLDQLDQLRATVLNLMAQVRPNDAEVRDTIPAIKVRVARRYNVSIAQLEGPRRTGHIALARQTAMYLCRQIADCGEPRYTHKAIAAAFRRKQTGTSMHACERITFYLCKPEFARVIAELHAPQEKLRGVSTLIRQA